MKPLRSMAHSVLACLALSALAASWVRAEPAPAAPAMPGVHGDFVGTLAGQLRLQLHIAAAADGTLSGTLDSPNQGAMGIPCADFHVEGNALTFAVPTVGGTWKGTIEKGGESLVGTWSQGNPLPLTFARDSFVPAAKPAAVDGYWLGTLIAGAQSLRIQLTVKSDAGGQEYCTVDSLDQGSFGLGCEHVI